jgi:hypothetical protein
LERNRFPNITSDAPVIVKANMKTLYSFYGITFVLLLVGSCQLPPLIVIYNHSGQDLIVHADKNTYQVRSNATGEIQYPGNEQILRIEDGSEVLRYKIYYPPKDYMSGSSFRSYVINCQIEPDRKIYVVKVGTPMPVKDIPQQPTYFPLAPLRKD